MRFHVGLFLAAAEPSLPSAARSGIIWFLIIFALLGLLLVGVILLTASRMRNRLAAKPDRPVPPQSDPWEEAGRRMKLEEQGPKE